MSLSMYLPIALIVVSNIFYHVCSKSMPDKVNPFAALTVTYLVGAAVSALIYVFSNKDGSFIGELKNMNWTTYVLGIAIVGLEAGSIYMYKAGWNISVGQLIHSTILAVCLIFVGILFYREQLNASKIAGIVICMVGLYFINR